MSSSRAAMPSSAPLQLDLFDAAWLNHRSVPKTEGSSQGHDSPPAVEALVSSSTTAPVLTYVHPQGDRDIVLGQSHIKYALKRVKRRSIGMIVNTEGLTVRVPYWVSAQDIESALREKSKWIQDRLKEQKQRLAQLNEARIVWKDGTTLPYLGDKLCLQLRPDLSQTQLIPAETSTSSSVSPSTLALNLSLDAKPLQIQKLAQTWLQQQALEFFEQRIQHFAERLGVVVNHLSLSNAQTRWGSASVNGTIRLNWRLIHFAPDTIDYVVAHELAHLRHMDHSPRFWAVVRSVVPDLERHKAALRAPLVSLGE